MTTREEDLVALSALMDGETQDLELRRLLGSAASDPESVSYTHLTLPTIYSV